MKPETFRTVVVFLLGVIAMAAFIGCCNLQRIDTEVFMIRMEVEYGDR